MARGDLLDATHEELCLAAELREATEEIERLRRENEWLRDIVERATNIKFGKKE